MSTELSSEEQNRKKTKIKSVGIIYSIVHLIISFFAIYLSFKCNQGFNILGFLAALICPYFYIIWQLATKGGCF
jgi:hypothetical protein